MDIMIRRWSRRELFYFCFLVILLVFYGTYLFSFTVFDGFATLSSDSFGYILLSRKWSPYFAPSIAETLTWPVHTYPPAFAWLLAITGASETPYAGHLAVTISMLLSILLIGWLIFRELGWKLGGLLTLALCLLPGAVFSSMSILSENLYLVLSLAVLLIFSILEQNDKPRLGWYIALFLCLTMALLTRSVAVSLLAALMWVALFRKDLATNKKITLMVIAVTSLVVWQLWGLLDPQSKESGHLSFIGPMLGHSELTLSGRFWHILGFLYVNLITLFSAWINYLSPVISNAYIFLFSFALFAISFISTVLRAIQLKLSAVYILLNLGILLIWPYPEEMVRFLHPVMMLILMQPVIYFHSRLQPSSAGFLKALVPAVIVLFLLNSLMVQARLNALRNEASETSHALVHSREYYSFSDRVEANRLGLIFQDVINLMAEASQVIPEGSTVASDQHAAFTLLANRKAVNLTSIVPFHQQICNFRVADVQYVFLSALFNSYNPQGIKLFDSYKEYSSNTWTINDADGNPGVYILQLDRPAIDSTLRESGFECLRYQDRPTS